LEVDPTVTPYVFRHAHSTTTVWLTTPPAQKIRRMRSAGALHIGSILGYLKPFQKQFWEASLPDRQAGRMDLSASHDAFRVKSGRTAAHGWLICKS
jgi:hypothetical protein